MTTSETPLEGLKRYFGFDSFRDRQEEIITTILAGDNTFVIMPTGGGKSLCYQLPALILEGTTIIVSPLIALMKNQVDAIRKHAGNRKIAHFLNSTLSKRDISRLQDDILEQKTKLLFIAPETLKKASTLQFLKKVNVPFVAIDEAHCISEWGHDFRPDYRKIKTSVSAIKKDMPIIALTATATPKVQSDICKSLEIEDAKKFVSTFNRPNLYYEVRPKGSPESLQKQVLKIVKDHDKKAGIVFVHSRKSTDEVAAFLRLNGIIARGYHAGLDTKIREKIQDDFLSSKIDVICATIAFGMGIDKPDIRFVIHYDVPKSLENYYQETGRAGRDGQPANCIAFYDIKDIQKKEGFLKNKNDHEKLVGKQLLQEVSQYSAIGSCRRGYVLNYFGENYNVKECTDKMCDNCRQPKPKIEAGKELQLLLSVVEKCNPKPTLKDTIDILLGNDIITREDQSYKKLEAFGKGKDEKVLFWNSLILNAIIDGYIIKNQDELGLLELSSLKSKKSYQIPLNKDFTEAIIEEKSPEPEIDTNLLIELQNERERLASSKGIPGYIIFKDSSLESMSMQYPCDATALANVPGVGRNKASKFGKTFIDIISTYVAENNISPPDGLVVKTIAKRSKIKIQIIQGIDRKISLGDLADQNRIELDTLLDEMNTIADAGTRLNITYYLDNEVDKKTLKAIYKYFMNADTGSIDIAYEALKGDDISLEEIKLARIQFLTKYAN